MLAADKLQLQSALKQQATALKEKEFSLHHNNLMTVGTQAAVLAGLDITMFIEFAPPHDTEWHPDHQPLARLLKVVYYGIIVAAFCANVMVVAHTTSLSVLGGGLALRGPDGSMMTATDVLYAERKTVFTTFGFGLACTIGSVLVVVWILLAWESALICWIVTLITCRRMYANYQRAYYSLAFDESQTVDFRDIFEGPANIQAVSPRRGEGTWVYKRKTTTKQQQQQHRQSSKNSTAISSNHYCYGNGDSSGSYNRGSADGGGSGGGGYSSSEYDDSGEQLEDVELAQTQPLVAQRRRNHHHAPPRKSRSALASLGNAEEQQQQTVKVI